MRLDAAHRFTAPGDEVCDAMGDPEFYATLRLPDVEPPEVIVRTAVGTRVDVHVRFTYIGKLDPIARRVVGHDHVAWVQRLEIDRASQSCTLHVMPEIGVMPVTCHGTFVLHDAAPAGSLRTLAGELRIKVPIIGGRAEKSLAPGIMRRLDLEAEALDRFLAG